jgi:acetolactate synthase I/II/III large subunit
MGKTGSQVLVEALLEEGVEIMFGYPGGVLLPLMDELYKQDKIKFVLTRHEQGAAHMADGYARASGKVGVCMATSGPGATNLTTGIATANLDSVPMIAITGQVRTNLIGNDAFQEVDTTGIMRPISKHTYLVKDVEDLARITKEAFHIARSGRPGPVVIDLPVDVTVGELAGEPDKQMHLPGYHPDLEADKDAMLAGAQAINEAKRPVFYIGGGIVSSGASDEVRAFAEAANLPVVSTLMGLGCMPADHPLAIGMPGMHGVATANYALTDSDLIFCVGARFDDRVTGKLDTFAPNAKIVHVDLDPTSISKNVRANIGIMGDAARVLRDMAQHVRNEPREAWMKQIAEWKKIAPLAYDDSGSDIMPQAVLQMVNKLATEDAIIATEVGQHQMWTAQYYKFNRPRSLITSGGLGTMGYGLPAALGAQAAYPDRLVVDIAGDGSIQMNMQELTTAVNYGLPVKVIVLNNGYLGMVRQWQDLFYDKRYAQTDLSNNPDFVKVAQAYGATGICIKDKADLESGLKKALETPGPVLVDVRVAPEENVFPMVPAGKPINEMLGALS